ncbi:MAG TPA: hypothetical protein VGD98_22605 [Ktedonobacteraceae bacterium]
MAILWQGIEGLQKDLLSQVSRVLIAGKAGAQIGVNTVQVAQVQFRKGSRVLAVLSLLNRPLHLPDRQKTASVQ